MLARNLDALPFSHCLTGHDGETDTKDGVPAGFRQEQLQIE